MSISTLVYNIKVDWCEDVMGCFSSRLFCDTSGLWKVPYELCVFLSQYICICVLSTSRISSFMAIWLCSLSVKKTHENVFSWQRLQSQTILEGLTLWTRALACSFNGFVLSLSMQTYLLLLISVSSSAFVLVNFVL